MDIIDYNLARLIKKKRKVKKETHHSNPYFHFKRLGKHYELHYANKLGIWTMCLKDMNYEKIAKMK